MNIVKTLSILAVLIAVGCTSTSYERIKELAQEKLNEPKEEPATAPTFTETDHGELLVWYVGAGAENAGKRVEVYEDGYHVGMGKRVLECVDGLTDWYADKANSSGWGDATSELVRDAVATQITCKPLTYMSYGGVNIPDKVEWTIALSSGRMQFMTMASADTIQSGAMHIDDSDGRRLSNMTINNHMLDANIYNGKVIGIR